MKDPIATAFRQFGKRRINLRAERKELVDLRAFFFNNRWFYPDHITIKVCFCSLSQLSLGKRQSTHWTGCQVSAETTNNQVHINSYQQFRVTNYLICISLDCRNNLKYLEEIHAGSNEVSKFM